MDERADSTDSPKVIQVGSIEDALIELKAAKDEYDFANDRYNDASHIRTASLNRLNKAQKKFDSAAAAIKKQNGVWGTDWDQRNRARCAEEI